MENDGREPLLDKSNGSQISQPAITTNGRSAKAICGTVIRSTRDQCSIDGSKKPILEQNEAPKPWMNLRQEWGVEVKKQLRLSLPMVLVSFFQITMLVVPLTFVGRHGKLELASAALGNSIACVTGLHILLGMASALETLCGQAYGAEQYHMLEIYFQRAVFVLFCVCVPITVIYVNIEGLLLLLGQSPEISEKSAKYVICLIPMIYANSILQPLVKFLQTQSIVKPMLYSGAATLALHVSLCWFMVYFLGLGCLGGAVATSISFWLNVIFLIIYVKWTKCCEKTFVGGFSKEAFNDLGSFLKLAWSSTVMICLEYWSFELMVLMAGMLANPELELSGLAICLNTLSMNYMVPLGLSAGASTRVSNELGAGKADAARRAVLVALTISVLESLVVSITFFLARHAWGSIFTNDPNVVAYVATLIPFLSFICICDGFQGVLSGVIRGAGWQSAGAFLNLLTFYGVGLPVGMVSAFVLGWAAKGLLTGLVTGLGFQGLLFGILTFRTNWEEQAEAAHARQIQSSWKNEVHQV